MHRNKLYKRIALVVIFVLAISAAVIYFTFDIRALDYLTMFSSWSVLCALGALAIGLFFDGTRLLTLARITGEDLPLPDVVKVVLSNYFLAVLTPGATGGAIAQVMFMRRAGVSVARSTVIILVRTIMSIFFLIVMLPIFMKQDEAITSWVPMPVIMTVSVIFIAIPIAAVALMRTNYPKRIIYYFSRYFRHERRRQAFRLYYDFRQAVYIMGKQPVMVLRAFIESGVSLTFIYLTVPAYFLGLQFPFDLVQVMGRMYLLNLVLYFSPTPGGSGIAEAGFVALFNHLVPSGTVGILAVLWRFTAEYLPFILGAFITLRAFGSNVLSIAEKNTNQKGSAE
ncbi:MAG: flippase-like domain-containing protein [Acidaminococcaceae bacterium]|nr:flippase-like domain-containing protein [Acidaminococcaceae bacterium]